MPTEVEAKFLADAGAIALLNRAGRLGSAQLGPPRDVLQVDRYLDTPDGRLADAGWACRLRERDGDLRVSLKGAAAGRIGDADGLHRRPEVEGPAGPDPLPASWPVSRARTLLEGLIGREPLVERLVIRQARAEREVVAGSRVVATLSLDTIAFDGPAARGTPAALGASPEIGSMHVVELEARGAPGRAYDDAVAALAALPGLRPDRQTKLERGLALLGTPAGRP
jgi:inorganic triphosphatase YgiF